MLVPLSNTWQRRSHAYYGRYTACLISSRGTVPVRVASALVPRGLIITWRTSDPIAHDLR